MRNTNYEEKRHCLEVRAQSVSDSSTVYVALFNIILYADLLGALRISCSLSKSVLKKNNIKLEIEKKVFAKSFRDYYI